MKIEGAASSESTPISQKAITTEDAATVVTTNAHIEDLGEVKSTAQAAMRIQLGTQASPTSDDVMADYKNYILSLIDYLTNADGLPQAAIQPLIDALNGIDPTFPNAATQYSQLMHQVCVLGVAIDPNFTAKLQETLKPGIPDANSAIASLHNQMANLINQLGPEGAVFVDMVNIQSWLADYPNNKGDGTALQTFGAAVLELARHLNDPPPWGSAASNLLTSLATVTNGSSLADVLGTLFFWNVVRDYAQGDELYNFANDVQGHLSDLETAFNATGIPFLQAVAAKVNWWYHGPYNQGGVGMGVYCNMVFDSDGNFVLEMYGNYADTAAGICDFSGSSVNNTLDRLGPTLNMLAKTSPARQLYYQKATELNNVQEVANSFQAAENGNWQQGFPVGPYQQSGTAPDDYSPGLSSVCNALFLIIMQDIRVGGDPTGLLTTALQNLITQGSGPPFPAQVIASLKIIVDTVTVITPFNTSQQALINQAFLPLDTAIAKLKNQQQQDQTALNQLQQSDADMASINALFKQIPNLTVEQWESVARSLLALFTDYQNGQDPAIKTGIGQFFNQIEQVPGLSTTLGDFLYGYLIREKVDVKAWSQNFSTTFPSLNTIPLAQDMLKQINHDIGTTPNYAADAAQLATALQGQTGLALQNNINGVLSNFNLLITSMQNQLQQDMIQLTHQQKIEADLKSIFSPGGSNLALQ